MSNKKVILQIGNVRVKEYDSMNVVIERLEEYIRPPREKGGKSEIATSWRLKGYASNILDALENIHRNEYLINTDSCKSLSDHLEEVTRVNEMLLNKMKAVI